MAKTSITHADQTYSEWLQTLDLYRQELDVIKRHLSEIGAKTGTPEVTRQIQELKRNLKTAAQEIESLSESIKKGIVAIGMHAELDGSWYVDNELSTQYRQLHEQFIEAEKTIFHLRINFSQFSTTLK